MARNRDELAKYLKETLKIEGDSADEVLGDIDGLVNAEKETGKKTKSKVNKEAEKIRKELAKSAPLVKFVTENLGYDPDEDDFEEFTEGIAARLLDQDDEDPPKKKKGTKVTPSPEMADVVKRMKAMEKENKKFKDEKESSDKRTQELETKQRRSLMSGKLTKALTGDDGKPKLYGHDLVVRSLIEDGKVGLKDDGETVVFIKGTGDDAEEIDFDEGVKSVIEDRKDLQVNDQNPGSGSRGGASGGGNPAQRTDSERLTHLRGQQAFGPIMGDDAKK